MVVKERQDIYNWKPHEIFCICILKYKIPYYEKISLEI